MSLTEWYRQNSAWVQIGSGSGQVPVDPPPEQGIIYGSHIGVATSTTDLINQMSVAIVRTYSTETQSASETAWSQTSAANTPVAKGASHTFKPNIDQFQTGNANYTTIRNRYRNILAGAPANQLVWVGVWHEPYDNMVEGGGTQFTLNEWRNLQINFKADVVDYVNASRGSNPIIFNGCIHGDSWGGHEIGGQLSVYSLYNADVRAALDEFSLDSYNYSYWNTIDEWQQTYGGGKRWGVWETGYSLNQTPTNAQVLARMQYWVETVYPSLTSKPSYVCWFNSSATNGNGITNGENPEAMAYWKALCESCPPATPANYFA